MSATAVQLPAALRFVSPPPGLEPLVDFTLATIENTPGLYSLTAGNGAARLFVLDATVYLPDYAPRAASADMLGIGGEPAAILVVISPGAQSTVNLAAPILLNSETGACAQVILEGSDWPLRAPLVPAG